MSCYEKDLEKIPCGMYFIELSNRLGKAIENVMGEKENMYNVIIFDSLNERKEYKCKRVYLRTDLSIMNLLTRNNEYITVDLKYVNYFEITTVEE